MSVQQQPQPVEPVPVQQPIPAAPSKLSEIEGYTRDYWVNVALVILSVLAVIANVVVSFSGSFFGLSDVQWHYVLAFAAIITALNTAFNRTPQVTQWPSKAQNP